VVIGVLLAVLVRLFVVQIFEVSSASMAPTLRTGDRIAVWKFARFTTVQRGDVVVFDGSDSFVAATANPNGFSQWLGSIFGTQTLDRTLFAKRVVALGGDHLVCCDSEGFLLLNDRRLVEPYLSPGVKPSLTTFDVTVPAGRMWVMGDNRAVSHDSRDLLGSPGGGFVGTDRIVGRFARVVWH